MKTTSQIGNAKTHIGNIPITLLGVSTAPSMSLTHAI
jgi:hypothetical protein